MPSKRHMTHRKKKVSIKAPKNRLKVEISNQTMKAAWNRSKTVDKNFERLGLVSDPNCAVALPKSFPSVTKKESKDIKSKVVEDTTLLEKWADIDSERNLSGHGTNMWRRPPNYVSEEICLYVKPLYEKYGKDFQSMFRDIKLNPQQYTLGWLRRYVQKYIKFMKLE